MSKSVALSDLAAEPPTPSSEKRAPCVSVFSLFTLSSNQ